MSKHKAVEVHYSKPTIIYCELCDDTTDFNCSKFYAVEFTNSRNMTLQASVLDCCKSKLDIIDWVEVDNG